MEHKNLSGAAMSAGATQALLEIINGCTEPGELSPKEKQQYEVARPRISKGHVGHVLVFSTADDLRRDNTKLLWDNYEKPIRP